MQFLLFILLALAMVSANAQTISQSSADLEKRRSAEAVTAYTQHSTMNSRKTLGNYGSNKSHPSDELKPYGAQLFTGGFSGIRSDGLNPAYKVSAGDQVILRAWGAIDLDRVLPVDSQGNIFIPSVGPVPVAGVSHNQLDSVVRSAVKRIYPNNVNVYTNLTGVQPVAVYVTGFVNSPGRYAGTPNDSALYFLHAAGGISDQLGSYREINIIRNGEVARSIDLYKFINQGIHHNFQFEDGDTIFVAAKNASVIVKGDVYVEGIFEPSPLETLDAVLSYAKPLPEATSVLVRGFRNHQPYSKYVELNNTTNLLIADGDELLVNSDQHANHIVVQIEGSFLGKSTFTLPKSHTLKSMLAAIEVEPEFADLDSVSIRRISVQNRQQQSLHESLKRLETTYLGASSSTAEEATIRIKEAELIQSFVNRARQVAPSGRLVVAQDGDIADIRLQDGDIITIPEKSDSILISGEVLVPQSVVFNKKLSAKAYIKGAGGFTQHADKRRVLVVRKNGEVREASDVRLRGGDEILVLPKAPTKNLQLASSLSQIIYQIAIAARVAIDI